MLSYRGGPPSAAVMRKFSSQRAQMDWLHSARDQPEDAARYDLKALSRGGRPDGVKVKREKLRRQLSREGRLKKGGKIKKRPPVVGRVRRVGGDDDDDDDTDFATADADVVFGDEEAVAESWASELRSKPRRRGGSAPPPRSTEEMSAEELAAYGKELLQQRSGARAERRPERPSGSAPPVVDDVERGLPDEPLLLEADLDEPSTEPPKDDAPVAAPPPAWRGATGAGRGRVGRSSRPQRYTSVAAARAANNDESSYTASFLTSAVRSVRAAYYGSSSV